MPQSVYVRSKTTGYQQQKCYLAQTNGCSTKITGEHCISHNLLNKIERLNKTIDVVGLSWLPKDQLVSVGKKSLVSNVLCSQHNAALSPLDDEIGELVESISAIDAEYLNEGAKPLKFKVDGSAVERWILKTILGLVHSGQIHQHSGAPFGVHPKCAELLCVPHARWPAGWGLYVSTTTSKVYHSSSFELLPRHNPESGVLLALDLKFNGIEMHFLMGRPDAPGSFGVHRPGALIFQKGSVVSVIELAWPRREASPPVRLTHAGVYSGASPDHAFAKPAR
jgi:hypothetical protein